MFYILDNQLTLMCVCFLKSFCVGHAILFPYRIMRNSVIMTEDILQVNQRKKGTGREIR